MYWDNVESSNIEKIAYYEGDLYVKFKAGTTYRYFSVPASVYEGLLVADSKGKFLVENIKRAYVCEKC